MEWPFPNNNQIWVTHGNKRLLLHPSFFISSRVFQEPSSFSSKLLDCSTESFTFSLKVALDETTLSVKTGSLGQALNCLFGTHAALTYVTCLILLTYSVCISTPQTVGLLIIAYKCTCPIYLSYIFGFQQYCFPSAPMHVHLRIP